MKSVEPSPEAQPARRKLALPRGILLLLAVTVWPLLIVLFHGVLPWAIGRMSRRFGWTERHPGWWNWPGLVFVGLGTIVVLWFWFVHVKKVAVSQTVELEWTPRYLLTDGPYRHSRNPMYLAVLTIWFGWAVFYGSSLVLLGNFLGWLLLNFIVIPLEERGLAACHQEHYQQYAQSVPRWF